MPDETWPALPYEPWKDTYATLHMWMQVVGKIALALAPPLNHSWAIAMLVTPRGLSTHTLAFGARTLTFEFDFIDHQLLIRVSDSPTRMLALQAQSVAAFYRTLMDLLREIGVSVKIWPMPVEVPAPAIRFTEDSVHHSYDPEAAQRCWRVVSQVARVLNECRSEFVGKCSPVHFFWGGFDLAVTRFSGRPAPPREGPAFMREAYSHEVISHGFWPGGKTFFGPTVPEPVLYGYAAPEPAGFKEARVRPAEAYYHQELGEFLRPYEAVRTAAEPDRAIRDFVQSTYEQAATLGGWNRAALERRAV